MGAHSLLSLGGPAFEQARGNRAAHEALTENGENNNDALDNHLGIRGNAHKV